MKHRITLALFAYNQEQFIESAVRSAFAQDCEPIQILLSDDFSTDHTWDQIRALAREYCGIHQITVRRNEHNLGLGNHFNAAMQAAEGELVVLAAGDDISLPNRVARTAEAWDLANGRLDLIAAHVIDMTAQGVDVGVLSVDKLQNWVNAESWAAKWPYIVGAAHSITRRLHAKFGQLNSDVRHEDQINTFRATSLGTAYTVDEPLVRYRRGGMSDLNFPARSSKGLEARRSADHLAMYRQISRDAQTIACAAVITEAISWRINEELIISKLLDAPSLVEQISIIRKQPSDIAKWLWKKLARIRMPRLAQALRRITSQKRRN